MNMQNKEEIINILHLRDSPWVDGPGRTIIESAALFDRSRFNYIIGGFSGNGQSNGLLVASAIQRGFHTVSILESGSFDINVFRQLLQYIEDNKIHIIHTHDFRSDLIGLICAKIRKVKVMTTLHGWIPNGLKGKVYVGLDKTLLHFFDHIIVVSERMKQQVLRLRVPEQKVTLLHNCIIADRYHKDYSDKSFKTEQGLDGDAVLIGKIGRLSPEKGQSDFVMAAKEVLKRHEKAKFVLLGIGPERQTLEQLADRLGILGSVIFAGYRTDMQRVYNSLDLVVQSSYTEGLPNVLLEALLMEVPVIATDVGGTPEIIRNRETGILIQPGSVKRLAEKIIQYIDDPAVFQAMAKRGKAHVTNEFNFAERTKKEEQICQELMYGQGCS